MASLAQLSSLSTDQLILVTPALSSDQDSSSGLYTAYSVEEATQTGQQAEQLDTPQESLAQADFTLHTTQCTADSPEDKKLLDRFLVSEIPSQLAHRNVDVVVSTKSGAGKALPFFRNVLEPLLCAVQSLPSSLVSSAASGYRTLITQDVHSVSQYARQQSSSSSSSAAAAHTIIVMSGDGGIVDLLNGTDDEPISSASSMTTTFSPLLVILPLGTANALFHSLHKPIYTTYKKSNTPGSTPLVLSLRTLFRPSSMPRLLPVFRARFSSGSHTFFGDERGRSVSGLTGAIVASYGLHASIVWETDTPAWRAHGPSRFIKCSQELLNENHGYHARVDATRPDGYPFRPQPDSDTHGYVVVALVSNFEREFAISPATKPLDGKLRLVHFGVIGGTETFDLLMSAYQDGVHLAKRWKGKDGREERVGYDEVADVVVEMLEEDPRWRKVCIDGTIVEVPQGGKMSISKGVSVFEVLVPDEVVGVDA